MKRSILFFAVAVLTSAISFSQTEAGNFLVGGSSSFSLTSSSLNVKSDNQDLDIGDTFSISLAPGAGYFVIDNLLVGLELPVGYTSTDDEEGETRSTSITATPLVRYYFDTGSNIKPFLQGRVGLGSTKQTSEFGTFSQETKLSTFLYGFDGGIAIFINDTISLDLGVGYNSTSLKNREDNPSNVRLVTKNIGFNAGFNVFL